MGRIYTARRVSSCGGSSFDNLPGLVSDYDPAVGVTIVTGVSNWADSSPAASPAILQATGAAQPLFVANAQNGFPGISFDGVDDYLRGGLTTITQPTDIFITAKYDDATTGNTLIDGTSVNRMRCFRTAAGTLAMFAGTQLNVSGLTPESYHVLRLMFRGARSGCSQDNAAATVGNAGTTDGAGVTLGATSSGAGGWAKVTVLRLRIFSGTLSDANAAVEIAYQRGKYGI